MPLIDIIILIVVVALLTLKPLSVANKIRSKTSSKRDGSFSYGNQRKNREQNQRANYRKKQKEKSSFNNNWEKNEPGYKRRRQSSGQNQGREAHSQSYNVQVDLAFFGLNENYSLRELTIARNNMLKENHPDKVSHMSEEIKNLAKQQTQKINDAFERLRIRL